MTVDFNVEGLPDLAGKLELEGRCRARNLEEEFTREELAYALVEREEQFKGLIDRISGKLDDTISRMERRV